MKLKKLLITTITFFLLVNTTYFWEGKLGILAMLTALALIIVFLVLLIAVLKQMYLTIRERFKNKHRIILIFVMLLVLLLTVYKPNGLINFDRLEGKDLLVAVREGVAKCMTTLKLKENNKFVEREICFGIREIKGKYVIKNDTILFYDNNLKSHNNYYKFAVFTNEKSDYRGNLVKGGLRLYRNRNDTLTSELFIIKNELKR